MHYKIIWMSRSLNQIFKLVLLDELIGNILVLAISMFYALVNIDAGQLAVSFVFGFFGSIALVMLYGYCFVGDQLMQQCINVQQAYYQCKWHDFPNSCKKSLLICMLRAQVTLRLTGGGFYIFSLYGFTEIMKTCLAYISMLRTLV
ncbi:odorant receptor 47a-like [Cardiocondyla obscurior]|uniref:odorant receptor 47a-like n=1 Tax=Cardiocondyla obscurior TaxID=286306 RepID=UPI00396561A3